MSEFKHLTTREVARLCRVSDATVKRWEQAGCLKSERTNGGHRRFRAEEVARFQRRNNIGLKRSSGDEPVLTVNARPRTESRVEMPSLFNLLIAGREEEAAEVFIGSFLRGQSLAKIFDEVLCPAMKRVGELWAVGDLSIAQEHLATRAALNAVYKLRAVLPVAQTMGAVAVCCSLEGDLHELPVHLAQLIFEYEGFEVINFGANMPLYSLTEEVGNYAPSVICISVTLMSDVERTSREYREFREKISELNLPVILGGKIFRDVNIRSRFPAELYADSFAAVAETASRIHSANGKDD